MFIYFLFIFLLKGIYFFLNKKKSFLLSARAHPAAAQRHAQSQGLFLFIVVVYIFIILLNSIMYVIYYNNGMLKVKVSMFIICSCSLVHLFIFCLIFYLSDKFFEI